eukprot:1160710-Pelagomonas_calceolata.AAC.3
MWRQLHQVGLLCSTKHGGCEQGCCESPGGMTVIDVVAAAVTGFFAPQKGGRRESPKSPG